MPSKKAFAGLLVILLPLLSPCQPPRSYKPGDTVSPAILHHVQQLAGSSAASLCIITFFSPTCGSSLQCISASPALEKQFSGSVKFISVTREDPASVSGALNSKGATFSNTPYTAGDTVLGRAFHYETVPHIVWISRNGLVRAITSAEHLTAANITGMLHNPGFTLPVKTDIPYDASRSLLQNLGLQQPSLAYSWLGPEIPGIPSARSRKKDTATNQLVATAVNMPLAGIYALAFKKWLLQPYQLIIDSSITKELFCYEFRCTGNDSAVQQQMLYDLSRHFNTTASLQKQQRTWYILQAGASAPQGNGATAAEFFQLLEKHPGLPFIENNLGSNHRLPAAAIKTITSAGATLSISSINQILRPYDFCISSRTALKEVLVINKIPNN
jgi:hypothetical protein